MAKHHNSGEKVYSRKINIACLLIGLVLTVLAIYAYTTLGDYSILGVGSDMDMSDAEALVESLETNPSIIIGLIFYFIVAIVVLVAAISLLRLIIGWFFFFGKKDSRRMAKKLAKHAKIAFGVMGSMIFAHILASADNGVFPSEAKTLCIVTAVAACVVYLAVRYYRWFVVEKREVTDFVFIIIRDAVSVALVVIAFGLVGTKFLGDMGDGMKVLVNSSSVSNARSEEAFCKILDAVIDMAMMFFVCGMFKSTLKFMPFDNYNKPAYKRAYSRYIPMTIVVFLLVISKAVTTVGLTAGSTMDSNTIIEMIKDNIDIVVKLVILTVSSHLLALVEDDEIGDVKLAVAAPAPASAPEAEPVVEEAPAEIEKTEE